MTEVCVHGVAPASERADVASAGVGTCAAFPVDREPLGRCRSRVAEIGRELGACVQLRCIGPLAAYSLANHETPSGARAWV